jgi:sterol desaturase/sphingolipid hydroxylase (fatty acid hydroxylase superfamily)
VAVAEVDYPTSALLAPPPYKGGDSMAWPPPTGAFAFLPMVAAAYVAAFALLPINWPLLFIAESFSFLVVSDKLHDCYHIEGHWLERYDWFLQRRERHFQHHRIHKQNLSLGGMDPVFDKLFGSYAEPGVTGKARDYGRNK